MRFFILFSLISLSLANQIQNVTVSEETETGFSVSWNEQDGNTDGYRVVVQNFGGDWDNADEADVAGNSYDFTSGVAAKAYNVRVSALNGTDVVSATEGSAMARTTGSGSYVTGKWNAGAMGVIMWPADAACSWAFTFEMPCEVDFLGLSADMTNHISMSTDDNVTFTAYVSQKAMMNHEYLQWFTASQTCDFSDFTDSDFTFTSFNGYTEESVALEVDNDTTWPNYPSGTTRQSQVSIPEEYRHHCAPTVSISVPCDVAQVNSWSINSISSTPFDGTSTVFDFAMSDVWQNSFGFAYSYADDCAAHNATFSLTYTDAPGI